MKKLKRIAAAILAMYMLAGTAFAETDTLTYKAKMENGEITVEEKDIFAEVDNSNLNVNVIKQQGNTRTTVFTGKLKDYDDGRWINLDFSEIQFALIFDWDTMENEVIYVIPVRSETASVENDADEMSSNMESSESSTQEVSDMTNLSNITYDVTYTVVNENMNILYSVNNAMNTPQTVNIISVLYRNGVLQRVISTPLTVNADTTGSGNIAMILPEMGKEECSVKMMVWENMSTIRPLGKAKTVKDIEPYLREKTVVISANGGQEFKLYMNSENAIGDNIEADHIIKFNPQKFEVVDLCGFTYEKELTAGKIENMGITIQSIDTQNGKIVFSFDLPEGRNTGTNNIVKFRALTDVSDEEITYQIQ